LVLWSRKAQHAAEFKREAIEEVGRTEMKIRRLKLPIDALSRLPENERTFLLMAGHMQNEFVALQKIFAGCISSEKSATRIEAEVNGSQGFMIMKILAGKLHEGWQLMNKAYFASKLSLALEPLLHKPTRHSLNGLKSYFSNSNLIFTVRNSFSFHYSAEEVTLHWQEAASEPDFDFFIGNEYGNSFYQASETAVNLAVINGINRKDRADALKVFLADVQNVAALFNDFLSGVMVVILERCFSENLSALGVEEEVHPTKGLDEIDIPFFYVPPSDQAVA
jgi:hypothetical protein